MYDEPCGLLASRCPYRTSYIVHRSSFIVHKYMKHILSISILLLLCQTSCTDDKAVLTILDRAEAMMGEHSDSAYLWLCRADSAIADQSKKTQMRHLMLKAEATNKLFLQMPSDTLFQEVVDYYDQHGTPNQQLKAHYLLGCIYRDMKEAPQAIQCYYDAVEKADTLSDDCDYNTLFRVYGQMAMLFSAQYMAEAELDAWRKYSHYAFKANDMYNYIHGLELTVIPLFSLRDSASVLRVTEKCAKLYQENDLSQAAARVYPTAILMLLEQSHYKKAYDLMCIFETESGLFDDQGNICPGKEHYYYSKGLYYEGTGRTDTAEYYYRKLLHFDHQHDAYKGLLSVYQTRDISDSIVKFSTLCERGLEQLLSENKIQSVMQLSSLYDYTRYQKIAMAKKEEAEQERYTKWGISLFCLVLFCIGIAWYTQYRKRVDSEIRELSTNYMDAIARLSQAQEELTVMKGSSSIQREAMLDKKQAEIKALEVLIEESRAKLDAMDSEQKESVLLRSQIVKTFRDMARPKLHSSLPTDAEWKTLITLLKQCLPVFYKNHIEAHQLSGQELYTVILVRLRFTSGEIACLLNTSPQRITNVKKHLNSKLFGTNSATNLYENLKKTQGVKEV